MVKSTTIARPDENRPGSYNRPENRAYSPHNETLGKCRKNYERSNKCNTIAKWGIALSLIFYGAGMYLRYRCDRQYEDYQKERYYDFLNRKNKK